MKIKVKQLRQVIAEELYRAWRYKNGARVGDPITVNADNTRDAAQNAADQLGVDPMTIDLEKASNTSSSGMTPFLQIYAELESIVQSMSRNANYAASLDPAVFERLSKLADTAGAKYLQDPKSSAIITYVKTGLLDCARKLRSGSALDSSTLEKLRNRARGLATWIV